MSEERIFIGQLSKYTGVPVKTIRYYEEFGLLDNPKRSASQYRIYSSRDVEKLLFVKKAKGLGLTLSEIKRIMRRSKKGLEPCCNLVRDLFSKKIKEYEQNIKELSEARDQLKKKLKNWVRPIQAKKTKYTICPQIK